MYSVVLSKSAENYLYGRSEKDSRLIIKALEEMAIDPFSGDVKKMKGSDDEYRRRAGEYRIIFTVENDVLIVDVLSIGHRKNIYH